VAVGLTKELIVEAALDLMDEHGQEWLTMRRLADHLDVAAPTLYWHVANRAELMDAAVEAALGGGALPTSDDPDWRVRMATFMRSLRDRLTRHPCVTELTRSRYPRSVQEMTTVAVEVAGSVGLSPAQTADLARLMIWQVTGFTTMENTIRLGTAMHEATGTSTYRVAPPDDPDAAGPVDEHLAVLDTDALFELQTSLLIAGVERLHEQRR
jgi:TetR/AcrR family transcriptional regulator, tetracycline repressor protein